MRRKREEVSGEKKGYGPRRTLEMIQYEPSPLETGRSPSHEESIIHFKLLYKTKTY